MHDTPSTARPWSSTRRTQRPTAAWAMCGTNKGSSTRRRPTTARPCGTSRTCPPPTVPWARCAKSWATSPMRNDNASNVLIGGSDADWLWLTDRATSADAVSGFAPGEAATFLDR